MNRKTQLKQSQRLDRSDAEFVRAFEAATLPEDAFRHADHVRLAWLYLREMPLIDAIVRYRDGLRRFAAAHGAPGKYHETITWAYVVLVHERLHDTGTDATWQEFAERNVDLMRFRDGAFFEYYGPDVLESEKARRLFVLPRPCSRTPDLETAP
jgi:hypothetical protein